MTWLHTKKKEMCIFKIDARSFKMLIQFHNRMEYFYSVKTVFRRHEPKLYQFRNDTFQFIMKKKNNNDIFRSFCLSLSLQMLNSSCVKIAISALGACCFSRWTWDDRISLFRGIHVRIWHELKIDAGRPLAVSSLYKRRLFVCFTILARLLGIIYTHNFFVLF